MPLTWAFATGDQGSPWAWECFTTVSRTLIRAENGVLGYGIGGSGGMVGLGKQGQLDRTGL